MPHYTVKTPWLALLALVALLVVALSTASGAASRPDSSKNTAACIKPTGKPLIIGAAIGQSGFIAPYDVPGLHMMRSQAARINCAGGLFKRQIKFVVANTNSDANRAAAAALEVLDKGAEVLVGTADFDLSHGSAQVAQRNGKLFVVACGSPKCGDPRTGNLTFNVGFASVNEGAVMAEWAYKDKKWRTTYTLLDPTIDYDRQTCRGFTHRWQEIAGKNSIVGTDVFNNPDPSIRAQITRFNSLSTKPDFLTICSYNPGAASAIRQFRASGYDGPILASASMDGTYWLEAIPDLSNFWFVAYASLYGDDPYPAVNALIRNYKKSTGELPGQSVSVAEATELQVIVAAIKAANGSTDGHTLRKALERLRVVPTAMGPLRYTKKLHLDPKRAMRMMEIRNGKPRFLKLWKPVKIAPLFQQ